MPQNIKYEKVSTEHLKPLAIYFPKVAEESDFLTMDKTQFSVASIQKIFLSNPFSRAIVARLENEIVGLVQMRQQPKSSEQHNGELAISVLKQQQGRNIGTELLRLSISQAKQEGLRYLYLDVRKDNARAIKLYEKFGFALYGIRPSYCHVAGKYFDNHLMVLALNRDKEE